MPCVSFSQGKGGTGQEHNMGIPFPLAIEEVHLIEEPNLNDTILNHSNKIQQEHRFKERSIDEVGPIPCKRRKSITYSSSSSGH